MAPPTTRPPRQWWALLAPMYILTVGVFIKDTGSLVSLGVIEESSFSPPSPVQSSDAKSFFSLQHTQHIGKGLARAFLPRDDRSWCTNERYTPFDKEKHPNSPRQYFESPKGLLFVKVPKAASSTMAGVVDRIAQNHGNCTFRDEHTRAPTAYFYGNRDQNASFLLGSIRDPAARAISRIFFQQVSQQFQEPTDKNILKWLNDTGRQMGSVSSGQGGFQLNYMTLDPIDPWSAYDWDHNTTVKNPKQVEQNVRRVIEQYDFIVVVERMDESLVVLQMLLGVNAGDVLTLDSKVQGSYYYTGTNGCIPLAKAHVSPRVKEYLSSDIWHAQNYGDYLLQAAASASLDRTIEALGRDRVERGLVEYRRLKAMANEICASKAFFACSANGVEQRDKMNCYKGDHGCGYPCIDEMLKSQSLASQNQSQAKTQSFGAKSLILKNQSSEAHSSIVVLKQRMQQIGTALSRAFLPHDLDSWCTKEGYTPFDGEKHPNSRKQFFESPKGLLYVKVPKAASSTMAGVVDRIARNEGNCDFQDRHIRAGTAYFYGNRDQNASFLLGSIRDPATRAISRIFFQQVSQVFQEPTDENIMKWLNETDRAQGTVSPGQGGFQLQYMSLDKINPWSAFDWNHTTTVKNPKQVEQNVRRVIEQYDFIVVVERMDESLVVLQMLLGVNVGDLLTLDSKVQGSYYYTSTNGCIPLVKSRVSPHVKEYLSSDVWHAQNYGDYLLHAAANASLDRTIEALGRDRVERGLVEYRMLKAIANGMCASKAIYACSSDGVDQRDKMNCYKSDHGCGYPCIDEMLKSQSLVSQNESLAKD